MGFHRVTSCVVAEGTSAPTHQHRAHWSYMTHPVGARRIITYQPHLVYATSSSLVTSSTFSTAPCQPSSLILFDHFPETLPAVPSYVPLLLATEAPFFLVCQSLFRAFPGDVSSFFASVTVTSKVEVEFLKRSSF